MLSLITGVPGSGKTLLAVRDIYELIKTNNNPKTNPSDIRLIFSDIDGLDFGDDVIYVDKDHDWRDTPDGSVCLYDEAHKRWPGTGKSGRSDDPTCRDLDEHRHSGHDIYALTQWPTKVHHELRTNVNRHLHVVRTMGAELATVYEWNQAQSSPDRRDNKDTADSSSFVYPKHLYKHYKSATVHTHKFKMPAKLKMFILLIFSLLSITVYAASGLLNSDDNFQQTDVIQTSDNSIVDTDSFNPTSKVKGLFKTKLSGCIANDTDCYCYTVDGEVLDQDYLECRAMESKPLPFPHIIGSNS